MEIREITTPDEKRRITRFVLESLPDWFGIPEAREEYIEKSVKQPFFAAFDGENAVGFLRRNLLVPVPSVASVDSMSWVC